MSAMKNVKTGVRFPIAAVRAGELYSIPLYEIINRLLLQFNQSRKKFCHKNDPK